MLTVLRVMVQTVRCAVKLGYVVKHYRSEIFEGAHRASIRHCNLDERFARILEFGKPIAGSRLLAECLEAKDCGFKWMGFNVHGKFTRDEL